MKLPSYQEILDGVAQGTINPLKLKSACKKAELKMAEIEEQVATMQQGLNEACVQKELNFDDIINRMDKIELQERRLKQMQLIIEQLFPSPVSIQESPAAK